MCVLCSKCLKQFCKSEITTFWCNYSLIEITLAITYGNVLCQQKLIKNFICLYPACMKGSCENSRKKSSVLFVCCRNFFINFFFLILLTISFYETHKRHARITLHFVLFCFQHLSRYNSMLTQFS